MFNESSETLTFNRKQTYDCCLRFKTHLTMFASETNHETNLDDEFFMCEALKIAQYVRDEFEEIPIGAVIVDENHDIIAVSGNRTRTDCDPTAHAEIIALREAAKVIGNYRLTRLSIYSTIEPCAMCAGALIQARIKRLVYGANDERFGAVRSKFALCDDSSLNHQIEIVSGVLESECRNLMQNFFQTRRQQAKNK